jgi:hypothetical protein
MSPASYQTAPPRDVCCASPLLQSLSCFGPSDWSKPCGNQACRTRAGNGTRTRDPNLGKVVLYQLSYSRER